MAEARIIKRYANRKLYDTEHSRYVTLEQISEMIRAGDDVKIVDNKSKEDLTSVTLAQIIFEEEKKHSFMPLGTMRNIIQNGGEWFAEAQRRVQSILPGKRRDGDKPDAEPEPAPEEAAEADSGDSSDAHKKRSLAALREWTLSSRTALDEWQRRVDEKIRTAIEGISPFSGVHRDVRALSDRIAELEAKLAELESHD
ncbi:MAG: transcriptional regulator [Myxococcales bacterium]|jgi:polyhydroxyalkanoate synthesis repressor PhaR|nr:transcriptional regulator [Myxococcales bacterium]HRC56151.1 polyhydroxyalkanoate synthesis regulator DNA-binding domain-containing protein [Kofleriaceae bacterium]